MRIWWGWCWRTFAGLGVLGLLLYLGLLLTFKFGLGRVMGLDLRSVVLAYRAFEFALGLLVSVLTLKWVIGNDFGDFRLALLEWRKEGYLPQQATWLRVLQLWWSLAWRNVIAAAVVYIGGFFLSLLNYYLLLLVGGLPATLVRVVSISAAAVLGFAIGLIPLKLVLQREYGDFHLALMSKGLPPKLT